MAAVTQSVHLLNDDVVTEILLRLPSLSVLRCRAVCKAWRAITTTSAFVAAYGRLRPPEIIVQRFLHAGSMLDTIPLATLDEERSRCLDPGYPGDGEDGFDGGKGYRLIACCDGLLLLERTGKIVFPRYAVCNPVTRQWTAAVPAPRSGTRLTLPCGFYLHKPSGQHRILFLTNEVERGGMGRSASHYVRSLEDAETRRLGPAAAAVHIMDPLFIGDDLDDYRGRFIHWLQHPEAKKTNKILAFDTVSETFRRMSRPPAVRDGRDDPELHLSLLEMDGMVAMMATLHGFMDLWVLEDYNNDETWTRRLRVQLPPTLMRARWAMNAGVQGHILLGDYDNSWLGLYDLTEKKVLKQIPITAVVTCGFRDSLERRHTFFRLQN